MPFKNIDDENKNKSLNKIKVKEKSNKKITTEKITLKQNGT